MKKIITLIFCILIIFSLVSCAEKNIEDDITTASITTVNILEIVDNNGKVWLTNKDVIDVTRGFDPFNGYFININTTEDGKQKLSDATTGNLNKTISLKINDELIFSATVISPITDGAFIINGFESEEEMSELFKSLTKN
ncbi:MAG: hypothetical protein J6B80_01255 [Clostridia bacterium]|nr:hypothetical protein [Clostridia bacterium]